MAAGLATYQWNNQLKSILLLLGFPLLLVLMVGAWCAAWDLWLAPANFVRPTAPDHALRAAFDHDGPALVDVATARQELALPPKLVNIVI